MQLVPHPTTPCPTVWSFTVDVTRDADLHLAYALRGDLAAIALPPLAAPAFADELWRHTCFEAFIGRDGDEAYYEYNFSPSGRWAVYAFAAYRQRREVAAAALAPTVDWQHGGDRLSLRATVRLAPLGLAAAALRIGASAVIETRDGGLSYWALHHRPGRPDFHHAGARTLLAPAPRGGADR